MSSQDQKAIVEQLQKHTDNSFPHLQSSWKYKFFRNPDGSALIYDCETDKWMLLQPTDLRLKKYQDEQCAKYFSSEES